MKEFIKKSIAVAKILLILLSLTGITGSFSLSASGEVPCPYCLIARYSILAILILSIVAILLKKNSVYIGTTLISILPIVASSILVYNDYFVQGGTEICYSENSSVHCTSPVVLGIHVSLYALLIGIAILFLSLFISIGGFILKNEGNNPRRK
jgi:disulfide bond formation protein DsbB